MGVEVVEAVGPQTMSPLIQALLKLTEEAKLRGPAMTPTASGSGWAGTRLPWLARASGAR